MTMKDEQGFRWQGNLQGFRGMQDMSERLNSGTKYCVVVAGRTTNKNKPYSTLKNPQMIVCLDVKYTSQVEF